MMSNPVGQAPAAGGAATSWDAYTEEQKESISRSILATPLQQLNDFTQQIVEEFKNPD
nr:hypothetical protein [uncultured Limnobacter sp.]